MLEEKNAVGGDGGIHEYDARYDEWHLINEKCGKDFKVYHSENDEQLDPTPQKVQTKQINSSWTVVKEV